MANNFTTGLIGGLVGGFSDEWEKQDQAKRAEKQKQLENHLKLIAVAPDDQKDELWQKMQAEDMWGMAGGGKGKGKGGKTGATPNPVLDRLKGLIFGQHPGGSQNPQKAPQNANAAPQSAPQGQPGTQPPPLQTNAQNGRPTLAGAGNADPYRGDEMTDEQLRRIGGNPGTVDPGMDMSDQMLRGMGGTPGNIDPGMDRTTPGFPMRQPQQAIGADEMGQPSQPAPASQPQPSDNPLDRQVAQKRALYNASSGFKKQQIKKELDELETEQRKSQIAMWEADQKRTEESAAAAADRKRQIGEIDDAVKSGVLTDEEGHEAKRKLFNVAEPANIDEKKIPGTAFQGIDRRTGKPWRDFADNPIDPKLNYTFGKDHKLYPEAAAPEKPEKFPGELGMRIDAHKIISDPKSKPEEVASAKETLKHLDESEKKLELAVDKEKADFDSPAGKAVLANAASNPGLDGDAWTYGITQRLPSMGISGTGKASNLRSQIVSRWYQIMASTGMDPADIVALRASAHANIGSLSKMTWLDASVTQFEGTLERNLKLAEALNKKYERGNVKFVNRVISAIRGEISDPAVNNFVQQIHAMAPEYAKIMAGSTSASGATVSGTAEAQQMFDTQISTKGLQAFFDDVIRPDMANRAAALEDAKRKFVDSLRGKNAIQEVTGGAATVPAPATTPAPAGPDRGGTIPAPAPGRGGAAPKPGSAEEYLQHIQSTQPAAVPAPAAPPKPPVAAAPKSPTPPPKAFADTVPEGRTATGPDGSRWQKVNGVMVPYVPKPN
jgi:hypothetical protein